MSYAAEITTGDGKYTANSLRFATMQEATDYAVNLSFRCTLVIDWRVAQSKDPVNSRYVNGEVQPIQAAA
jgi:hypothetical protein